MTVTPEQFNKLVTRDEFSENSARTDERFDELNEKMDIVIGMLEKSAKKDADHETEHISNIAAHDRFQRDIDQLKTQIKTPANA